MSLSSLGQIAERAWVSLAERYSNIRMHGHVVMPNHVHGIIEIVVDPLAQQAAPLQGIIASSSMVSSVPLLSVIVRSFKADVTRRAGDELGVKEEIWQRNYFDRVIRDGREYSNAERYISENPARWHRVGQTRIIDG